MAGLAAKVIEGRALARPPWRRPHVLLERRHERTWRRVTDLERDILYIIAACQQRDGARDARSLAPLAKGHLRVGDEGTLERARADAQLGGEIACARRIC